MQRPVPSLSDRECLWLSLSRRRAACRVKERDGAIGDVYREARLRVFALWGDWGQS
jgi:hypothetical protein